MSWDYRLAYSALKNLKRFPGPDRRRIYEALEAMKSDPFRGDVKPIQGEENLYRRRVGAYRIYFRPALSIQLLEIPEIIRKQSH